ncbi:MAG: SDR family oxidoreductase [Telmatospirillum sp.]|nr:SDR family oxidoreductase [Telmatospirillum sp.]
MRVLVFGASGYVGTNLVPALLSAGHCVRAAARRLDALEAQEWDGVTCVKADALQPDSLSAALEGIDIAYYLVHSMAAGTQFPELDRRAATAFRDEAARAGVKRIIYLGGVQPGEGNSVHLASRCETGRVLREGSVPVTELRAGIIIGPGSAAFEVIRDLVFHLPAMVTPKWVFSRCQPIALDDVLSYLTRLPDIAETTGRIFDIGGPEVLSYRDMMMVFGDLVKRRPVIVPVPLLTPRLSSYWLAFVTSVPANVARALIGGLEHDVLAEDRVIRDLIPIPLKSCREAIAEALEAEKAARPRPRWVEGSMLHRRNRPDYSYYAKHWKAEAVSSASAEAIWRQVAAIGGENGYYFLNPLWQVRGRLDALIGGAGMGRKLPVSGRPSVGDTLDFWRVVTVEPPKRLTLLAEMRLPGSAILDFEIRPGPGDKNTIVVDAHFHPAGLSGIAYWNALLVAHAVIFRGLVTEIARRAEAAPPDAA